MNLMISSTTVVKIVETCGATWDVFLAKDFVKGFSLETKWITLDINFK